MSEEQKVAEVVEIAKPAISEEEQKKLTEARQLLQQEKQKRNQKCIEEINLVLQKHNCKLEVGQIIITAN